MKRFSAIYRQGYGVRLIVGKALLSGCILLSAAVAQAEQIIIAALGDSVTQGYGLPPDEGFVTQLQRWLDDRDHSVKLINAGVSGDTTAGGLARVDWTLTQDVDGMILALGGNDMLRGTPVEEVRANLEGILKTAQEKAVPVLLIGYLAPPNFGPDYQSSFNRIFPDLAESFSAIYSVSFLSGDEKTYAVAEIASCCMQPDRLHPNAKGVELLVELQGPKVEALINKIKAPR